MNHKNYLIIYLTVKYIIMLISMTIYREMCTIKYVYCSVLWSNTTVYRLYSILYSYVKNIYLWYVLFKL